MTARKTEFATHCKFCGGKFGDPGVTRHQERDYCRACMKQRWPEKKRRKRKPRAYEGLHLAPRTGYENLNALARKLPDSDAERRERAIQRYTEQVAQHEAWIAEHGEDGDLDLDFELAYIERRA